jgi:hypothetical protein
MLSCMLCSLLHPGKLPISGLLERRTHSPISWAWFARAASWGNNYRSSRSAILWRSRDNELIPAACQLVETISSEHEIPYPFPHWCSPGKSLYEVASPPGLRANEQKLFQGGCALITARIYV